MNLDKSLYDEKELIVFEEGLFGFDDYKKFLPLPVEEGNNDFLHLLSVDDNDLSFIIVNPFALVKDYKPNLSTEDYKRAGTEDEGDLNFYAICVVSDVAEKSTVNLRCPIVVNVKTRKAVQVILTTDKYGFRHSFSEFKKEE